MILVQNIIDSDKRLFTILFDRSVMKHLKCKCNDYLIILQSNFNASHFIIAKSDTGYKIRRYPKISKTYQSSAMYPFRLLSEFDFIECSYFLKKNNSIRIILNI